MDGFDDPALQRAIDSRLVEPEICKIYILTTKNHALHPAEKEPQDAHQLFVSVHPPPPSIRGLERLQISKLFRWYRPRSVEALFS